MTPTLLLALALTALQAWDGWTTYKVLRLGGVEQNPLVLWLMERIGAYRALLVLKGFAVALAWVLALMPIPHPAGEDIRLGLLVALGVFYVIIAAHNYNALCKLRERR